MSPWAWVGFFAFIAALLALDLGVFQRGSHEVQLREALTWCVVWVALALAFGAGLAWWRDAETAQQYLAAYLVELCLSVDNVFVFILIFAYFKVAPKYQHHVLFWGIIGAVVMRTVFILVGVGVISRFHWVLYGFGAFLIYTGVKLILPGAHESVDPEHNLAVRLYRRFFPVAPAGHEPGRFFVVHNGRRMATTLFIVLLVIETSDLMFAVDSIPAVLAITTNGFVALTSNIFAILGLRSLYFALHGVMGRFRFLKFGLALILGFIGAKMLGEHWFTIRTPVSLAVIGGVIATAILLSLAIPEKPRDGHASR